jgi:nicotinate-nucleotide adenylyltransferase
VGGRVGLTPGGTTIGDASGGDLTGGIGILGGTFDPIHYGHLAIAEQVREVLGLVRVLFVPAGAPPHKRGREISPGADRARMVELGIAGNGGFALSPIELDRDGPSYTVDTLERLPPVLAPVDAARPLVLILSAEAVAGLPAWHRPRRLLELCHVAVVPRRGYDRLDAAWVEERFPGSSGRFRFLDGPDLGHSASDIRDRVRRGRSVRYLVPPAVEAYIGEHRLYRSPSHAIA